MLWIIGFIVVCYLGFKLFGFLLENLGRIVALLLLTCVCYYGFTHYVDVKHTPRHLVR